MAFCFVVCSLIRTFELPLLGMSPRLSATTQCHLDMMRPLDFARGDRGDVISTKRSAWRDLMRFLDKLEMTKGGRSG